MSSETTFTAHSTPVATGPSRPGPATGLDTKTQSPRAKYLCVSRDTYNQFIVAGRDWRAVNARASTDKWSRTNPMFLFNRKNWWTFESIGINQHCCHCNRRAGALPEPARCRLICMRITWIVIVMVMPYISKTRRLVSKWPPHSIIIITVLSSRFLGSQQNKSDPHEFHVLCMCRLTFFVNC